ncbi:MAG: alpha-ribazole phosphatase family protein [Hahellaceae bacterium]|nr:alpha-ribazole phosphatase family protein [Hahellaceae bacterium]MCP5169134.1 alpha-ribazole phosphatase family protein [Hahellaceae bacterium]
MHEFQETLIDLMRHGEPVGGRRLRGSQDDPLSDDGWRQMRRAVGEHNPWKRIISSPLLRCAEFASELSNRHDIPIKQVADFREIGFGDWEGMTPEEVMKAYPSFLQNYWKDPVTHTPPQAETLDNFMQRVKQSWQTLLAEQAGQHTLLVCHGGTIRAILTEILAMPAQALWRIEVPYANISRIRVTRYPDGSMTQTLVFHKHEL